MMAAAMTTRNLPLPTYEDLAKAGAVIRRDVVPARCERLTLLVEDLQAVTADLSFCLNERARIKVTGSVVAKFRVACQLCTVPVAFELRAEVEGILASSESQAVTWRDQESPLSIIVVSGPELDELELVEDELLLRLPSRVCINPACDQRPTMVYGSMPGEDEYRDTPRPFAALAELRRGPEKTDESAS